VAVPIELANGHVRRSALTPRQREIAVLIARGLSNADIADQLMLTNGTVANHVASILQRLDLDSRTQIATWGVHGGIHGAQDRLLTTLERLLEVQPASLNTAMDHVATLVAQALDADKVDAFLHDAAEATLYAVGISDTPLGHKQAATGLDRQAVANGGRTAQVFVTGEVHFNGDVQNDEEELIGVRRELGVRSQVLVPLEVGEVRRGVLAAQSTQPDYFAGRDLLFLRAVSRWVGNMVQRIELGERTAAAAVEEGRRMAAEELVTVLAHDLRNHLAPIRGRLEMLHRRAVRDGHDSTVHDTVELRKSVDRLGRLVSDLLDIARIDKGLFELTPEPTDLAALVREAASGLEVPGTTIEVDVASEVLVVADPSRVRQAVENLLANAVQHAPTGTVVSIQVAQKQSGREPSTVITVSDRGPGINPQLLPRLFDRFARSSDSTGLGIGLFLVRQIAEAHGGRLDVTSSSATGTQFSLVLPTSSLRPE
jgi:signal transduction histidine kinase/DNA-binding CsgD family transcriptional regulator